jgi:PAS domain S-box-containing protein
MSNQSLDRKPERIGRKRGPTISGVSMTQPPEVRMPSHKLGWFVAVSLVVAVGLELLGRYLSRAHRVGYGITGTLTLLALLVWGASSVYVIRRVHRVPRVTRTILAGACLLVLSQAISLSDLIPLAVVASVVDACRSWQETFEDGFFVIGLAVLFGGFYLSVFEADRANAQTTLERHELAKEVAERRRTEQALRESEEKYRTLVDSFPQGVLIIQDGRVVFANPAAAALLRRASADDLLGADPLQFVVERERNRVADYMRARFAGTENVPASYETVLQRTTGEEFPSLQYIRMITFKGRPAEQIVGVDMTEQKRAEQTLRDSEARFRRITENMSDMIREVDVQGRLVYVSPSHKKVLGYGPEDMLGKPMLTFAHPEDADRAVAAFHEGMRARTPRKAEYRYRRADGRYIWIESVGTPILDEAGALVGATICARDITERRQAEEALWQAYAEVERRVQDRTARLAEANQRLQEEIAERERAERAVRESEERYRGLIEGLSEAVYRVSLPEGRYEYMGPAAQVVFGYTAEEIMREPFQIRNAVHPDFVSGFEQTWATLQQGQAPATFEYTIIDPDGKERWILQSNRLIRDDNGKPVAIEGICRNVTEEKRAQQLLEEQRAKLAEASKMSILGEMASNIAHEVNNPLAVVSGSVEQLQHALLSGSPPHDVVFRLTDTIMRNTSRIQTIVKGLRSFARKAEQDPFQEASLKAILEDTVELCRERFEAHHASLSAAAIPEHVVIECRPTQIMEVLVNLLSNALHAVEASDEKWVVMAATDNGDAVEIAVTDSGGGIPAEVVTSLFERFATTKDFGKGAGLGLSISRRIVQSHNGILMVDSSSPHTRFVIRLPKCQPPR